jgi:hypothetical protein
MRLFSKKESHPSTFLSILGPFFTFVVVDVAILAVVGLASIW